MTKDSKEAGKEIEKKYTIEEARKKGLLGWNIRCNLCGSYGAEWIPGQRPGWGCLSLCPCHKKDLENEIKRHYEKMEELRKINFEQEHHDSYNGPEVWD